MERQPSARIVREGADCVNAGKTPTSERKTSKTVQLRTFLSLIAIGVHLSISKILSIISDK